MEQLGYYKPIPCGFAGGWKKHDGEKPLFGGAMGTVFDCYVIVEDGLYKMWYSWRPTNTIVYATSTDGIHWTLPRVVLSWDPDSDWEMNDVSRPSLIKKDGLYHMWYTGHVWRDSDCISSIGYATSQDGIHWKKRKHPVLVADQPWERKSLWCSHVLWEEDEQCYKMWYSGGATHLAEANAIGYATSKDAIHWEKDARNPIFTPDPTIHWEMYKVSANYVWKHDGWYYMTYLGSDSDMRAANGMARSRDGITNWQRHPDNPTFGAVEGDWDCAGNCKATVIDTGDGYMAWYNGFNNTLEEMGLAFHKGYDFGFPEEGETRTNVRGDFQCSPVINKCPFD